MRLPDGALQIGKEQRQRLRIVPDMLAGSRTGALFGTNPFPPPQCDVFQPQAGRRDQNREIRCRPLKRRLRNRAFMQCAPEQKNLFPVFLPGGEKAPCRILRSRTEARVVVFPAVLFQTGIVKLLIRWRRPGIAPVRKIPADQKTHTPPFPRRKCEMPGERSAVARGNTRAGGIIPVAEHTGGIQIVPVDFQGVAPAPPEPVFLKGDAFGVGCQGQFSIVERILSKMVAEQKSRQTVFMNNPVVRLRIVPGIAEHPHTGVIIHRIRRILKRDLKQSDRH